MISTGRLSSDGTVGATQKRTIEKLLGSTHQLWRGRQANRGQRALSTGHAKLDTRLPGNGWPLGAVTELISRKPGLGELRLLFPALADTGKQGQWVILVDPPWIPYPASLQGHGLLLERLLVVRGGKDSLWACEQALRSGRGGAVLAWPEQVSFTRLRRLQVATESSAKLAFLFRPESALQEPSPAALRLQFEPGDQCGTRINILKCRGNHAPEPVWIPQPFSHVAFDSDAKRRYQTQDHVPLAENNINTALAGDPPSTTCPGPPYPRSKYRA